MGCEDLEFGCAETPDLRTTRPEAVGWDHRATREPSSTRNSACTASTGCYFRKYQRSGGDDRRHYQGPVGWPEAVEQVNAVPLYVHVPRPAFKSSPPSI
ncbi:unnamed protein product [Macrosiphum euphorbiae]|uniref:Uncharacterized protein n=1 Tax=Macrosiphum euphorbiae TaxID=13131 RepID=A0AAV0XUG6_9HEMI|nr:unnamed protein product [Macrosiphum euphorbiae]